MSARELAIIGQRWVHIERVWWIKTVHSLANHTLVSDVRQAIDADLAQTRHIV